jgi:hypothetical protein
MIRVNSLLMKNGAQVLAKFFIKCIINYLKDNIHYKCLIFFRMNTKTIITF